MDSLTYVLDTLDTQDLHFCGFLDDVLQLCNVGTVNSKAANKTDDDKQWLRWVQERFPFVHLERAKMCSRDQEQDQRALRTHTGRTQRRAAPTWTRSRRHHQIVKGRKRQRRQVVFLGPHSTASLSCSTSHSSLKRNSSRSWRKGCWNLSKRKLIKLPETSHRYQQMRLQAWNYCTPRCLAHGLQPCSIVKYALSRNNSTLSFTLH